MQSMKIRKTAGALLLALALLAAPAAGAAPAPEAAAADWLGALWERALEWLGAPLGASGEAVEVPATAPPPPPSSEDSGDRGASIDPDG